MPIVPHRALAERRLSNTCRACSQASFNAAIRITASGYTIACSSCGREYQTVEITGTIRPSGISPGVHAAVHEGLHEAETIGGERPIAGDCNQAKKPFDRVAYQREYMRRRRFVIPINMIPDTSEIIAYQ